MSARAAEAEKNAGRSGGQKTGAKTGRKKASQPPQKPKNRQKPGIGSKKPHPKGAGGAGTLFTRRNGVVALVAAAVGLWLLFFYPFSTDFTRRAALGLSGASAALLVGLLWRVRAACWSLLLLLLACAVFMALPGRTNYDRLALRAEFARVLRCYEGVRFCKGGEGAYGIDGPGLVRRASIEAPLFYGIRTVNPWLVRHAFEAWWNRELPLGRWPLSRRISKVKSVHGFNDLILYAGDYALLDRGKGEPPGAIVYLGYHEWIVADAERATVAIVDGRKADASPGLQQSGALYRWRLLEARR